MRSVWMVAALWSVVMSGCVESVPPGVDDGELVQVDAGDATGDAGDSDAEAGDVDESDATDDDATGDARASDADSGLECLLGSAGCGCAEGACNPGLECVDDLCAAPECSPGDLGCICADADFCESPAVCDRDEFVCREAETCGELNCAPRQLCNLSRGVCESACAVGYFWDAARGLCLQEIESSCVPGEPGSLAERCAEQRRNCRLVAGRATCGECWEGYYGAGSVCSPGTCGEAGPGSHSVSPICARGGRVCEAVEGGGARCGACLPELVEDRVGACVEPTLCEDLRCGEAFRDCDPNGGFARCGGCSEGYVESPEGTCVRFETCEDIGCVSQSRTCELTHTAQCGACLPGFEEEGGACVCIGGDTQYWIDADGDGFGDPSVLSVCAPQAGYVDRAGDCNDASASTYPGAPDVPDLGFVDSNCDGVDGDASRLVFVRAGAPNAGATGTPSAPFGTLAPALAMAQLRRADGVALSSGVHEGPLQVVEGVAVYGGYDAALSWARSASAETVIRASAPDADSGRLVGLMARGVVEETLVQQLQVETVDQAQAGASNYGAAVFDSPGLVLEAVTIRAGAGGAGVAGEAGAGGAGGAAGAAGAHGRDSGNGGAGGVNASCPEANGGAGGRGGARNNYGASGSPEGCGGAGGADGMPWANEGQPGEVGCSRGAGAAGSAGGVAGGAGVVADDWWSPASGSAGSMGSAGLGGGGGGGGGGAEVLNYRGGGGGGGGAGGCAGLGGGGGGGGGGSFGLWVVRSAGFGAYGVRVESGAGGSGGAGGPGGAGGAGAVGGGGGGRRGVGGSGSGVGGAGGSGGAGGAGGAGGSGAGGSSVAVYCVDGAPDWSTDEGSAAGASEALAGPAGAGPSGISQAMLGCE